MALSTSADRAIANNTSNSKSRQPVAASLRPFHGSFLGSKTDGMLRPLTAGDLFFGVSERTADTQDVSAVDGGLQIQVDRGIATALVPLTGVARSDVGANRNVYASDDGTFSMTAVAGNTWIGNVIGVYATNIAVVQLIPHHFLAPSIGSLGIRDLADANVTLTVADLNKTLRQVNTAARTITLPPAATCAGMFVTIVKNSVATFAVTAQGNAAENIDGANTLAMTATAARDRMTLQSDGTGWTRVA